MLRERSEIIDVEMTTIASAVRSPTALAAKPIAGGPARNPSQPIVETAAIPTPGGTPAVDPAARNTTGTMTPTPAPMTAKPASAAGVEPTTSASPRPVAASRPPPRASASGPRLLFRRSPTTRLVAIASANAV